jgi:hypothetical protein
MTTVSRIFYRKGLRSANSEKYETFLRRFLTTHAFALTRVVSINVDGTSKKSNQGALWIGYLAL